MSEYFSEELIAQAKETSLTQLAEYYGYHPRHVGNRLYTLAEHDSVRIYNDRTWYRWSRAGNGKESGGSQIDFLMQFCGVESVHAAIHQAGEIKPREHAEFVLPEAMLGTYRRAYAYLIKTRGLSQQIVDYFVRDLKILYEEKEHHNLVFLGKDKDGIVRYATKRGTADIYGKKYRGDVAGNDKNYGINIVNEKSTELKVFEANIDLMSYMDIKGDFESNKLVLGMTADNPLVQFLKDHPHIKKITFCMDNDEAGMLAMFGNEEKAGLLKKYEMQGYETDTDTVPQGIGCKDWNEYLIYKKNGQDIGRTEPIENHQVEYSRKRKCR